MYEEIYQWILAKFPPTRFDQYEWNYLRYEITEISGVMYFRSSSGWELWIQNNVFNDTEKYSKMIMTWNIIFFKK